jgi:hypothetical protein
LFSVLPPRGYPSLSVNSLSSPYLVAVKLNFFTTSPFFFYYLFTSQHCLVDILSAALRSIHKQLIVFPCSRRSTLDVIPLERSFSENFCKSAIDEDGRRRPGKRYASGGIR